jgi:large subunit ribosomal protein L29
MVDLRSKTDSELKEMLLALKKELMALRFQKVQGSLANSSRFKIVRKTVAKIMTLVNNERSLDKEVKNA